MVTKIQKEPKRPAISQNDLKKCETIRNDPILQNWELWIFLLVFVFQISTPNAQIWAFWDKKYWLFNLTKTSHVHQFECADFKFVICFWKFRAQISKLEHFGPKKYEISNLNEISHVSYFEGAYFKFDIRFWKCWAQMPKSGHLGPKSINVLILIKFCLYPILKILISNLTMVFENFGIS